MSSVRLLFLGDIVGEPGRRAVRLLLEGLVFREAVDFVVANAENSAGGNGITAGIAGELFSYGVDVITTGDHVWDQKETASFLTTESRVLRPSNYPPEVPGSGAVVCNKPGLPPVAVLNLQGRTFMPPMENPFLRAQSEVARLRTATPVIFVDFHAEATSEKIAMGRMLDGLVSGVVGTHTHVQTADEQVFPGGTAYLSDAGFTGPHDSVLGRTVEPVLRRFLTGLPQRFEVAQGRILMQGALLDIDPATGRARSISRVSEALH
ncbi:MAG: TIGR00282 family metallophosphoesterase [Verrucomicrobium sp.]|jgi:metallophosphoesterase (TIGR00282 family)|nr:TIGR00282 family metallophosphoesterase [Verrucomicrobium sp.]